MADLLDWRLEEDVYPMVRHLIYYREARIVDVPRIQNYYAVSPLFDLADLPKLSTSWSLRFSSLPPLPTFLASLSSALRPFSTQIARRDQRQLCLDALIWLLRHEVVVQMHVRLRLVASEACKRRALLAREEERERIKAKRAHRQERKAEELAASTGPAGSMERETLISKSAPAAGDALGEGERFERGRSKERSKSPGTQDEPAIPSALSATRPRQSLASPTQVSQQQTMASPSTGTVSPNNVEPKAQLFFERRRVLRSRSPSQMLGMATGNGGMPSSYGTRTSGSSRPGTPRGRPRRLTHSREASVNAAASSSGGQEGSSRLAHHSPTDSRPRCSSQLQAVAQAQSVPAGLVSAPPGHQAARLDRRSRSPSQARLRVTGFGEDEEVYFETGSAQGAQVEGARVPAAEEMRHLSLVGEEKEPTGSSPSSTAGTAGKVEHAPAEPYLGLDVAGHASAKPSHAQGEDEARWAHSDAESDDEDRLDDEIVVEPWESNPVETIIADPIRASGDENEWIATMVEDRDPWLSERLYKCVFFSVSLQLPQSSRFLLQIVTVSQWETHRG